MKLLFICLLICIFSLSLVEAGNSRSERGFCDDALSILNKLNSPKKKEIKCQKAEERCTLRGITCDDDYHITAVNWSGFGITAEIPDTLWSLEYLQSVDLSYNSMITFEDPDEFGNAIVSLNLSMCGLEVIPDFVSQISSLQNLVLSSNSFSVVSSSIWGLANLKSLDLSNNTIYTFEHTQTPGRQLKSLNLSYCGLDTVPGFLYQISLNNLDLSHNNLYSLTAGVSFSDSVKVLNVSHNKLQSFSFSLYKGDVLVIDHNCLKCEDFSIPSYSSCVPCEQKECTVVTPDDPCYVASSSDPSPSSGSGSGSGSGSVPSSTSGYGNDSSEDSSGGTSQSAGKSSSEGSSGGADGGSSDSSKSYDPSGEPGDDSSSEPKKSSSEHPDSSTIVPVSSTKSSGASSSKSSSSEKPIEESSSIVPAGSPLLWVYIMVPIFAIMLIIIVLLATPIRHKIAGACGSLSSEELSLIVNGERMSMSLSQEIGKGSFGTVWLAQSGSLTVAAKEMVRRYDSETEYKKEMDIMSHLDSKYVVHVYGSVVTDESYFIVMEYVPLGSLSVVIKSYLFSPFMRTRFMLDIARGMEYLHSQGVIHRDLKPGNVLVSSIDPDAEVLCKITDFGASRQGLEDTSTMTMTCGIGSPYYMSPEMLRGDQKYTRAVDIYSFGIMGAELWNEKQPFSEVQFDTPFAFARYVLEGHRPEIGEDCPPELVKLFNQCWDAERLNRPAFAAVVKDLEPVVDVLNKSTPDDIEQVIPREGTDGGISPGAKSKTRTKGRTTTHGKTTRSKTTTNVTPVKEPKKTHKHSHKHSNHGEQITSESTPVSPVSPSQTPPDAVAVDIPLDDFPVNKNPAAADEEVVSSDHI